MDRRVGRGPSRAGSDAVEAPGVDALPAADGSLAGVAVGVDRHAGSAGDAESEGGRVGSGEGTVNRVSRP